MNDKKQEESNQISYSFETDNNTIVSSHNPCFYFDFCFKSPTLSKTNFEKVVLYVISLPNIFID